MARVRSPNYPAISLSEAIERIERVHNEEHRNDAPREVIARHLGYGGLNGAALKVISALLKYGLLEGGADKTLRVSNAAINILFPEDPPTRTQAIVEAARKPALFAEIMERWPEQPPSDENLRAYLIHRNFARSAIDGVISALRGTLDLVTQESGGHTKKPKPAEPDAMREPLQRSSQQDRGQPTPPPQGIPFRVALEGDAIEVTGRLTTPEEVDKLVKILEINKVMITPVLGAFDTEYTDDEEGRQAEKRDRERD